MATSVDPLKYHYDAGLKLDYFILSADIALLGWTVVNTDWLPAERIYVWLMGAFWMLIALSIVSGIIRQLQNAMLFGVNHQSLHAAELASNIERAVLEGGGFINQQTGEVTPGEALQGYAVSWREKENKGKEVYEKLSRRAQLFGNLAIALLAVGLFVLAGIKISVL